MSGEPAERIEELENRVNALEATVSGLTEELVDRTERVRALEAETGVVPGGANQRIITAGEDDGSGATDGGTSAAAEETAGSGESTNTGEAADSGETGGDADAPGETIDGGIGDSEILVPGPEDGRDDGPSTQTAKSSGGSGAEGERATSDEGQGSDTTAETTDDAGNAGATDAGDGANAGDAAESGDDIIVA